MNQLQCETCGKKDALVFHCNYCGGYFCAEHHLPENHNCNNFTSVRNPFSAPIVSRTKMWWGESRKFMCPKCGSYEEDCMTYNAKTMSFSCKQCGNVWVEKKNSISHLKTGDIIRRDIQEYFKKKKKKHWWSR